MIPDQEMIAYSARGQKRLQDWKNYLTAERLSDEQIEDAQGLMKTYALLLAKVIRAKTEQERSESTERISAIERQLNSLFNASRLVTNFHSKC